MAVVAHHQWTRANRCPNISVRALLADPGLVLEPDFERRARTPGRASKQRILHQIDEVFLKVASAAASFFGWNGRGCSRVKSSRCSHLAIVLWCTSTSNRSAT